MPRSVYEQILEAVYNKMAAVRPLTSHYTYSQMTFLPETTTHRHTSVVQLAKLTCISSVQAQEALWMTSQEQ